MWEEPGVETSKNDIQQGKWKQYDVKIIVKLNPSLDQLLQVLLVFLRNLH